MPGTMPNMEVEDEGGLLGGHRTQAHATRISRVMAEITQHPILPLEAQDAVSGEADTPGCADG